MTIDCYGYSATSEFYKRRKKSLYQVSKSGTVTYMRFSSADEGPIHKISESDGTTTISWAYGSWENRASLTFTMTLEDSYSA